MIAAATGVGGVVSAEPQTSRRALEASADRAREALARATRARSVAIVALAGRLIVVVNVFTHGNFFTAGNLTNVLRQITYNAILAVGQTFVIITAGIDLSVGSLIELTGVVMAQFANAMRSRRAAARHRDDAASGVAVGCGAGLVNALPVVRLNLPPFITTLAMMLMARGLAFKLSHGQPVPLNSTPSTRSAPATPSTICSRRSDCPASRGP